jgi:hypothetical protein
VSVINLSQLKNEEIHTPARAEMIEKVCPKCGFGRMNATGRVAQPDKDKPPIYEHACSKCRHKVAYDKQYPRVEFYKIESEKEEEKQ